MVNMVRMAGLRDAGSEALRDLPGPVDPDHVEAWGHGPASPETIPSAVWAAANDVLCTATGPAGGMPPPRLPRAVSMSVNAKGAGRA